MLEGADSAIKKLEKDLKMAEIAPSILDILGDGAKESCNEKESKFIQKKVTEIKKQGTDYIAKKKKEIEEMKLIKEWLKQQFN